MIKLLRYIKPFFMSIIFVILLLFGQAYCELTLPDYMQNIVNIGIQNNGIQSGVFDQIRESTFQNYLMISTDEQRKLLLDSYDLITTIDATDDQISEIPCLSKENVYFLKDVDQAVKDDLNNIFSELQMIFLEAGSDIKDGDVDIQNEIERYQEQAKAEIEALGDSTISSMTSQFVKKEYEALGMKMVSIQQSYIIYSGLGIIGYALLSVACAVIVGFLSSRIAAGLSKNLRQEVFKKVTYFSTENFNKFNTSTLITRTTNDIQQVQMALVMMLRIVVYAPIMGVGALIHVMDSEDNMTWIIALCVIVILSVVLMVFLIVMPKFKMMQRLTDRLNSVVRELLDGMLVIRAFNNEKAEQAKFDKANRDITKVGLFTSRAMAIMLPVMMFLKFLQLELILCLVLHIVS